MRDKALESSRGWPAKIAIRSFIHNSDIPLMIIQFEASVTPSAIIIYFISFFCLSPWSFTFAETGHATRDFEITAEAEC